MTRLMTFALSKKMLLVLLAVLVILPGLWLWWFGAGLSQAEMGQMLRDTYVWVQNNWTPAMGIFLLVNLLVTLSGIPIISVAYVAGGYMFGPWLGALLATTASTVGCAIVFWLARSSKLRRSVRRVNPKAMQRAEKLMKSGGWEALLAVRILPGIPFPAINLGAALLNVPLGRFVWTTFFGLMPSVFLLSWAGEGLDQVVTRRGLQLDKLMTPHMLAILAAFGLLALVPLGIRWWRGPHGMRTANPA